MAVILHIGAHRTGTTAMQQMLLANRDRLQAAGVRVLVHERIERQVPGFAQVPARGDWAAARRAFERVAAGAQDVLISEENMIGDMGWNIRSGTFYWRARKRLSAWAAFLPEPPRRVGLGIRSYESYWISAHAQELSYRNVSKSGVVRFVEKRAGMAAATRGWGDLVADVRAAFPGAEILVWPVEARLPVEAIAARLLGRDLRLVPPPPGVNSAPDPALIEAMEQHRARHPAMKRAAMQAWAAAQEPGRFTGFEADERERMAERYAADLAALAREDSGVTLLGGWREAVA